MSVCIFEAPSRTYLQTRSVLLCVSRLGNIKYRRLPGRSKHVYAAHTELKVGKPSLPAGETSPEGTPACCLRPVLRRRRKRSGEEEKMKKKKEEEEENEEDKKEKENSHFSMSHFFLMVVV